MNVQLLNVNEAMEKMDQMINQETFKSWFGNTIKEYNDLYSWFKAYAAYELDINTNKGYIDIFKTNKSLIVSLKDKYTNKPIKKLYMTTDITNDFILAYDGLYYNQAWSKSGNKIVVDGLGWTLEKVREYKLQYEIIPAIQDKLETKKDDIRIYFN